ncbi:MAG: TonB-dependent receptor [Nitrospirota bacterium]|nr:TonB-dependent receptor [Nitrospirota bacterium]
MSFQWVGGAVRRECGELRSAGWRCVLAAALMLLGVGHAHAQFPDDLTDLSIEQLMEIEVVSPMKKASRLADVPAAVFVITRDDIRRSGASTLPDLLRMVPGLHVARIAPNSWVVSARGFSDRWTNKLLVLMDGRPLYTPLFSGVFWDVQDTLFEDIERIEIIRGPGATLWGANAVNGVINIITASAHDSRGQYVSASGGTIDRARLAARQGGAVGHDGSYRAYATLDLRDGYRSEDGTGYGDEQQVVRGGFRVDLKTAPGDALTLQGDAYDGYFGEKVQELFLVPPYSSTRVADDEVDGYNLQARWVRTFSNTSDLELKFYTDSARRNGVTFSGTMQNTALEVRHRFSPGARHDLVWGAGATLTTDDIDDNLRIRYTATHRTAPLYNVFVQDEIALPPDGLRLTAGVKVEHNDYTGVEVQPGARLLWAPNGNHSLWASLARAIRQPSRSDHDMRLAISVIPGAPPGVVTLMGDGGMVAEELVAWEAGYRARTSDALTVDLALFFNDYKNLLSFTSGAPFPDTFGGTPYQVYPQYFDNNLTGESYGAELAADWRPSPRMRVRTAYSWLKLTLHSTVGDPAAEAEETATPEQQLSVRLGFDPSRTVRTDLWLRYVGDLSVETGGSPVPVDAYLTADLRLAWHPAKHLEFALVGRNLADGHVEFPFNSAIAPLAAERSLSATVTGRF